jgi:hypothetical protein
VSAAGKSKDNASIIAEDKSEFVEKGYNSLVEMFNFWKKDEEEESKKSEEEEEEDKEKQDNDYLKDSIFRFYTSEDEKDAYVSISFSVFLLSIALRQQRINGCCSDCA